MRLIDADNLKDEMCAVCLQWCNHEELEKHLCIQMQLIDKAPTIEAAPIKYGKWQFRYADLTRRELIYECSECGCQYPKYKYCPHCGADMRKGDESYDL